MLLCPGPRKVGVDILVKVFVAGFRDRRGYTGTQKRTSWKNYHLSVNAVTIVQTSFGTVRPREFMSSDEQEWQLNVFL